MSYIDEIIIRRREEEKQKQYTTLDNGVYIDGKMIEFDRRRICEKFSVMFPTMWKRMPDEFMKIKYPSEFRPQEILTSPDLSINFGFTVFIQKMQKTTQDIAEQMQRVIHRAYPDYQMYSGGQLEKNESTWFAFRSHALDSDLYNMMLVVKMQDTSIQGVFNCPYSIWPGWKKIVTQIWETMETEKGGLG